MTSQMTSQTNSQAPKQSSTPLLASAACLCLCLAFSAASRAQQAPPPPALWNTPSIQPKPPQPPSGPAPRRDISGTWDAFARGIQPSGVKSHAPFTDWGKKMADAYKPGDGPRKVALGSINDPLDGCDPAGFPRDVFFELRPLEIAQIPDQVLILYEYQKVWRAIWTDGRMPRIPNLAGTDTPSVTGRMITRLSSIRWGSTREPGSTMPATHTVPTCASRSLSPRRSGYPGAYREDR